MVGSTGLANLKRTDTVGTLMGKIIQIPLHNYPALPPRIEVVTILSNFLEEVSLYRFWISVQLPVRR